MNWLSIISGLFSILEKAALVFLGRKSAQADHEEERADNAKEAAKEWADNSGKSDSDIANQLRDEAKRSE